MMKLPPPSGQEQNLFDLEEQVICTDKSFKKEYRMCYRKVTEKAVYKTEVLNKTQQ